ncbi:MAG: hypothetical protein ACT443_10880 [Gemmatimonadota bacterium]
MNRFTTAVLAGALAVTAAACDDDSAGLTGSASTSVSFMAVGDPGLLGNQTNPENPMTIGAHTIVVSSVELNLSEIEVEGEDDDVKTEIRGGTILVALPIDGRLVTPINVTLAAGTFDEIEMDVASARIRGSFDGQPFDITVNVDEELEQAITPPLVVEAGGTANLTIAIAIESWFRNPNGTAIDLLNLNATARAQLSENIEASFDAFDDHDRDGDDDD